MLEYEDFRCQEIAKVDSQTTGILSLFSKQDESKPSIAKNLDELNSCLNTMVLKYETCLQTQSAALQSLYDKTIQNYEEILLSAPTDFGYKKDF